MTIRNNLRQTVAGGPNPKYDLFIHQQTLFKFWSFIGKYYQGELLQNTDLLHTTLREFTDFIKPRNPKLVEGLELISTITNSELQNVIFDYNQLFIGPDKLLAPPYESAYCSPEGLLMQDETLAVRSFYFKAGLEVSNKGQIPDDHLGLEAEFLAYLLWNQRISLEECTVGDNDAGTFQQMYSQFINQHIITWIFDHCNDVIKHSTTNVCRAIALIMYGVLDLEKHCLV